MTEQQAQEIVDLVRAATGGRAELLTTEYFQVALHHLDYKIALASVTIGNEQWTKFPSWGQFKEIYRMQKKLAEPEERVSPPQDWGKRGDHAPEWVSIWQWCRLLRDPRETRFFPQQETVAGPENILSQEEYTKLKEEWEAAGSPKPKTLFTAR